MNASIGKRFVMFLNVDIKCHTWETKSQLKIFFNKDLVVYR